MTKPKCPKCSSEKFASITTTPDGSNYKISIIYCAACGCAIGVLDAINVPSLIHELARKLKVVLE